MGIGTENWEPIGQDYVVLAIQTGDLETGPRSFQMAHKNMAGSEVSESVRRELMFQMESVGREEMDTLCVLGFLSPEV